MTQPTATVPLAADALVDLDGPGDDLTGMPAFSGTLAQAATRLVPGTYVGQTYAGHPVVVTVTDQGASGTMETRTIAD